MAINLHTTLEQAIYTEAEILSLATNLVTEGRFYLASDTQNVYIGKNDGSVLLVGQSGVDRNFVFEQNTLSDIWVINHFLGKKVSVQVYDENEKLVVAETEFDSNDPLNVIYIKFTVPFRGTAVLN